MNKLPFYASLFVGLLLTPYQPWAIVLGVASLACLSIQDRYQDRLKSFRLDLDVLQSKLDVALANQADVAEIRSNRHHAETEIAKALNSKLIAISDRLTSIENDRSVQASEAVRTGIGMR